MLCLNRQIESTSNDIINVFLKLESMPIIINMCLFCAYPMLQLPDNEAVLERRPGFSPTF